MLTNSRGRDEGFTLVELMVVIVVFGVLVAVATASLINVMQTSRRSEERTYRSAAAQTALERFSKDARVAIPVEAAAANDLTVRVYRNGACEIHRYHVDTTADTFLTTVRRFAASSSCTSATGTASAAQSQVLARYVTNDASNPQFTYQTVVSGARQPMTAPIATQDLKNIQGLVAELDVLGPEGTSPIVLRTSVELRNN